jgi:hypothetical protein
MLFIYLVEGNLAKRMVSKIGVTVVLIFVGLSAAGLAYPKKPAEMVYRDFKRGAVLAYNAGYADLSSTYINKALSINPEGDAEIMRLQVFIEGGYYDFGTAGIRKHLKSGWSTDEGEFVWAVGKESEFEFELSNGDSNNMLVFRAMPYPEDQFVTVILNENHAGEFEATPGWEEYRLPIGPDYLRPGKNRILFRFRHVKSPAETGSKDERKLAMAFDWLGFEDVNPGKK